MGSEYFEQRRCPPQLAPYLDLLLQPTGCYFSVVPDGAFSFHPDTANGSWGCGLLFQGWEEVLYTIQADYYDSKLEGAPSSLRYKRLIKLLEAQVGREG